MAANNTGSFHATQTLDPENPDFNTMTVTAAMQWVNAAADDARAERMARVLAHVRPETARASTQR